MTKITTLTALLLCSLILWPLACDTRVPPGDDKPVQEVASDAKTVDAGLLEQAVERLASDKSAKEAAVDRVAPKRCEAREAPDPKNPRPHYAPHEPVFGSHCDGTNHQDIKGVQKVVFVGDSITKGTPPTPPDLYYRNQLTASLMAKFGKDLEVKDCSAWGARTDDLLRKPNQQLKTCLPNEIEPKRTLIVMTIGGNDMQGIAKKAMAGETLAQSNTRADDALTLLKEALLWSTDKKRFPNGSYVLMGNVYEYTDGTGDLASCEASKAIGLGSTWDDGVKILIRFNEVMMKLAVETKTDMIFMLERFCGHGFRKDDPTNACYRGADAPAWFDLTCTHPSPAGHSQIARMFMNVVNE